MSLNNYSVGVVHVGTYLRWSETVSRNFVDCEKKS